jgi:hypothetical protein
MNWRSSFIWLPVLVIFVAVLAPAVLWKPQQAEYRYEIPKYDVGPHGGATIPSVPTNWVDVGIKIGGLIAAMVNLTNLLEKIWKWIKKRKK